MSLLLFVVLASIFASRIFWLYLYRTSGNIGFILPFIFECIFVYPYAIVDILGLAWSYFGVLTMYMFALSLQLGFLANLNETSQRITISFKKELILIIYLLLVLVFLGVFSNHGAKLLNITNVSNLLVLANNNAVSRYDSTLSVTLFYKVSTIFSFLLAFILGIFVAVKNDFQSKMILFLFFGVLFVDSVLMAARAGLLLQLSAYLSSFLLTKYVINRKGHFKITVSKILFLFVFFVIIYSFFVVVQVARGGKEDFDVVSISSHVLTWFVGYLSAFDIWITEHYNFQHTFGLRTFSGLADFLHISQRTGGVYLPVEVIDGRVTNIYTAYRGLIEDFTLPISFLLVSSFGLIITKCLHKLISSGASVYFSIMVMIIYFILWSFVINPYIYNTVLLAMFVLFIVNKKFMLFKKYD